MEYNVNNLLEFENVITTPTHTLTYSQWSQVYVTLYTSFYPTGAYMLFV